MAGAIGGVSLILLVLALIAAIIAKKNNIRRPSDTNEGNRFQYYFYIKI